MYVVKKYIRALSAEDAIRQDKTHKVDDVFIDHEWKDYALPEALGFSGPYELVDDDE